MPKGKIAPKELKEKVLKLRLEGWSFTEITRETGVVKSTLHEWLKGLGRPEKYKNLKGTEWMNAMRIMAVAANKKKYQEIYKRISERTNSEVEKVSLDILTKKCILSSLYWAEGTKGEHSSLCFANTDPKLMKLFITLLRECYSLDESKFHLRLHLHGYHQEDEIKNFWSDLLNIPLNRFQKTYRKPRSKEKTFRRNFGGICFLLYNSVYLRREIMDFGHYFAEKISGKVDVPIVPVA